MNYNTFFKKALEAGIEVAEIKSSTSKETSVSLFHGEIDSYSISNQSSLSARGIYKGKLGACSTEQLGNDGIKTLIDGVIQSASYSEKAEAPIIFKGSPKYKKGFVYSEALANTPISEKIDKLYKLEKAAKEADPRVIEVQVQFEESETESVMANSYGLKLKNKSNYIVYYVSVVVKDGEEVKSDYDLFFDNDIAKFDPVQVAKKAVNKATSLLHGQSCKPKSYKCILEPAVAAQFLSQMVNAGFSAENVQKHTSVLEGKLNTQVFSKKVTIDEKPLAKNFFYRYFDSEGVATYNKTLVKNGTLLTYLYNLETAAKEGRESTGNASKGGALMGIKANSLVLKPGKKSKEELIAAMGEGIIISSISGLHSGLDAQSGNFSLQASGFMVKDGKVAGPLTVITVGGNLYQLFADVKDLASDLEYRPDSTACPSVLVKGLKISSL